MTQRFIRTAAFGVLMLVVAGAFSERTSGQQASSQPARSPEIAVGLTNQPLARQSHVHCPIPQKSQSSSCGSTAPAAGDGRPNLAS